MSPAPRFTYARAKTLTQALELLAEPGRKSRLLAGGTDLLIRLRQHEPDFDRVIDISRLPELKTIERAGDVVRLGSGVTYAEIIKSELLQELTPFLVTAARWVGGPQIRNQGTIGGNIVNAAGGADMLAPLVCLDATLHLASLRGQRTLVLTEFILHPNQTRIQPDEALTELTFPAPPAGVRTTFTKLGRRKASYISRISLAVMGRADAAGRIDFIRFAPSAVAPRVQRYASVEAMLLGQPPSPELFARAGEEAARVMLTLVGKRWSSDYKIPALQTITRRALSSLFETRE